MTTETKFFKKTMGEMGPNLPMGFPNQSGEYIKTLSVKPWTMKAEKKLGKMRDKAKGSNVAKYITMIVGEMCKTLGPYNFEGKEDTEKQILISQMLSGDVFYVYMWLRRESMGNEVHMKMDCPNCGKQIDFIADLNSVEVNYVNALSDLDFEYELKDPIEIRGKKVSKILLGPMKWSSYEMMSNVALKNAGVAKEGIILGSVKKCDGIDGDIILVESEIDELSKYDFEKILKMIQDNSIGPDMSIEGVHEQCGSDFVYGLDWSYDNFFGSSSQ